MSDKTSDADKPTVEIDPETLKRAEALLPATTLWARAEGLPDPSLADVIGLAVDVLAAQVAGKANAMVEQWREAAKVERDAAAVH